MIPLLICCYHCLQHCYAINAWLYNEICVIIVYSIVFLSTLHGLLLILCYIVYIALLFYQFLCVLSWGYMDCLQYLCRLSSEPCFSSACTRIISHNPDLDTSTDNWLILCAFIIMIKLTDLKWLVQFHVLICSLRDCS